MSKNNDMYSCLQNRTKIEICTINDIDEKYREVHFFIGNKKVGFRNNVIKICYDEDKPINNNNLRMHKRINNFINKMKRNIKVSLSI